MSRKKGITQPPIEAPVLPDGYYYRIGLHRGDYGRHYYWSVNIRKKLKIGSEIVGRSSSGFFGEYGNKKEDHLKKTCEYAWKNWQGRLETQRLRDKYEGEWDGS